MHWSTIALGYCAVAMSLTALYRRYPSFLEQDMKEPGIANSEITAPAASQRNGRDYEDCIRVANALLWPILLPLTTLASLCRLLQSTNG